MSFKIEHHERWLAFSLAGLGLFLWWVYLWTLSPAFPPNDSPETITACLTLGIQHPPGYPLHTLLGRLCIVLVKLGSPAWRMNLFSAFLAVVSALSIATLTWRLTAGQPRRIALLGALGSGLAFGLWRITWQQATEAKGGIYLLNIVLCVLAWHAGLSLLRGPSVRAVRGLGLLLGLAWAHHYLSAAVGLLPVLVVVARARQLGHLKNKDLASAVVFAILGLSLYLYLPLRSRLWPVLDLGHPADWRGFWWTVLRKGYTQASTGEWASVMLDQARVVGWGLLENGAWIVALLAPLGVLWAWRRERLATALWTSAGALTLVSVVVLNRTPWDNRWLTQLFILPAVASVAIAFGLALVAMGRFWRGATMATFVIALLASSLLYANAPFARRDGVYLGYDYGRDLSLALPRGALYLVEGDFHLMPLIYVREVEGRRRDALPALVALLGEPWYRAVLERQRPGLFAGLPSGGLDAWIPRWAERGPVALSAFSEIARLDPSGPWRMSQHGLARVLTRQSMGAGSSDRRAWRLRFSDRPWSTVDPVERQLLPWYIMALVNSGNQAMGARRPDLSEAAHRLALALPGDKPEAGLRMNLALALEAQGRRAEALAQAERGREHDPSFSPLAALIIRLESSIKSSARLQGKGKTP